jgi:hypothetical protein
MKPLFWLIASMLSFLIGLAAFVYLFILDINIYYFILAPVILALYLSPSAFLFGQWRKAKRKIEDKKKSDIVLP